MVSALRPAASNSFRAARASMFVTVVAALLAGLTACSEAGQPLDGVLHLDPRLYDGRSSAALLSEQRSVLRTIASADLSLTSFAPFEFENAVVGHSDLWGGKVVRAANYDPARGISHAFLTSQEELEAGAINLIEIDLIAHQKTNASLTWWRVDGAPGQRASAQDRRVDVPVAAAKEVQTVRFRLAGEAGWRGRIGGLSLFPVWKGPQTYQLKAIRFVREGFSYGNQPMLDGGDGGLLGAQSDERRTWPSDWNVPLYARFEVPRGGRLCLSTALPSALCGLTEPVHFAVDVRTPDGWFRLGEQSFVPAEDPGAGLWRDEVFDLAHWSGDEIEVRLLAWKGSAADAATDVPPAHASVWWGVPIVTGTPPARRRPNVLLVTLDTTRVDALGPYGGSAPTPWLDAFAAQSLLFENAWTACNSTLPAHTSILTGLDVPEHGVLNNRSLLAAGVATLPQALRAAGYRTAAAVSTYHLEAGYSGLGLGFDEYLGVQSGAQIDGALTLAALKKWIENWALQGEQPIFLWVHLFDPHTPYRPPAEFLEQYASTYGIAVPARTVSPATIGPSATTGEGEFLDGVTNRDYARYLYDAGVTYTDALLADLFTALQGGVLSEPSLTVLTADHGESLGEQDVWYGHQFLHQPVMHVPLLIRLPRAERTGRRDQLVSTKSITPTVLSFLGLEPLRGVTEFEHLLDEDSAAKRAWFVHSDTAQIGFRDGATHFFVNNGEYRQLGRERTAPDGQAYLFDTEADPACEADRATQQAARAERLAEESQAWLEARRTGVYKEHELTDEERQRLEALGYSTGADDD